MITTGLSILTKILLHLMELRRWRGLIIPIMVQKSSGSLRTTVLNPVVRLLPREGLNRIMAPSSLRATTTF